MFPLCILLSGLFEVHKLLYSFLIAVQVMRNAKEVSSEEWQLFLVGSTVKDDSKSPQPDATKSWMDAKIWLNVLGFQSLPVLDGLAADITSKCVVGFV